MNTSLNLFGQALLDYSEGDQSASIIVRRDDAFEDRLPVSIFYCDPTQFTLLEATALSLCKGKIIDAGAGTGIHSLYLQQKGYKVSAVDMSPEACGIMSKRGVVDVKCIDILKISNVLSNTILLLGHGIGLTGTLNGLDSFLDKAQNLVLPGGQLLINSMDVRCTSEAVHLDYQETNRENGKYFGEIRMQFIYKDAIGEMYEWLHVDANTLAVHASQRGWKCESLFQDKNGEYLAQLTRID